MARYAFTRKRPIENRKKSAQNKIQNALHCIQPWCTAVSTQFTMMRMNDATIGWFLCSFFLSLSAHFRFLEAVFIPFMWCRSKVSHIIARNIKMNRNTNCIHKHYNQINSNKRNSNFISLQTILIVAAMWIGINHTMHSVQFLSHLMHI